MLYHLYHQIFTHMGKTVGTDGLLDTNNSVQMFFFFSLSLTPRAGESCRGRVPLSFGCPEIREIERILQIQSPLCLKEKKKEKNIDMVKISDVVYRGKYTKIASNC